MGPQGYGPTRTGTPHLAFHAQFERVAVAGKSSPEPTTLPRPVRFHVVAMLLGGSRAVNRPGPA